MFSTTSWVLKKWFYNIHNHCHKTLCSPINCCLWSSILGNPRINRFFWREDSLFEKKMFLTTSPVLKNGSYNFHSTGQITLWTLIICSLSLFTLDSTCKNRPKPLITAKTTRSETFFSIDLLVPKEMILSFAQKLSKNLVDPD